MDTRHLWRRISHRNALRAATRSTASTIVCSSLRRGASFTKIEHHRHFLWDATALSVYEGLIIAKELVGKTNEFDC